MNQTRASDSSSEYDSEELDSDKEVGHPCWYTETKPIILINSH